jgi:hypothetical protein
VGLENKALCALANVKVQNKAAGARDKCVGKCLRPDGWRRVCFCFQVNEDKLAKSHFAKPINYGSEAEFFQTIDEDMPWYLEQPGGLRTVAAAFFKGLGDEFLFEFFQGKPLVRYCRQSDFSR